MGDCKCVSTRVAVSGDMAAKVTVSGEQSAKVSVGTVTIRDGTNDYERLVHLPRIEGVTLKGDKTLPQIGVGLITEQDIDEIIYG